MQTHEIIEDLEKRGYSAITVDNYNLLLLGAVSLYRLVYIVGDDSLSHSVKIIHVIGETVIKTIKAESATLAKAEAFSYASKKLKQIQGI